MEMRDTIDKIKDAIITSAEEYDPETEFGISKEQYDTIIASACEYFEKIANLPSTKIVYSELGVQEEECESPLDNKDYQLVYEKHDFANAKDAISEIPEIEGSYILHFETTRYFDNSAFGNVILGYTLEKNKGKNLTLGCNSWESEDGRDHFWLLKYTGSSLNVSK